MKPSRLLTLALVALVATAFQRSTAQTALLTSVDSIIGERQASGNPLGYYQNTDANQVGTSGSAGSRVDANLVLGFALPTLPEGETVASVQFRFGIKAAFDQTGLSLPDLHVYLLPTRHPAATGTSLFHHGPVNESSAATFVGTTTTFVEGVEQNSFPTDREDRTIVLSGEALTLFQSFYGGDHLPDQPKAFFRFNLGANPDEKKFLIRYTIDIAADQASVKINAPLITYLDATAGPSGNTFATGRLSNDFSWVGPKVPTNNNTQWNRREDVEANGVGLFQALPNGDPSGIPELTTTITGLADGHYDLYAFFWDDVVSDTQNWLLSAGLASGELTTYQAPFGPAVAGATHLAVINAQNLPFTSPIVTRSADGSKNLFGIKLGQAAVHSGSLVPVFVSLNLPGSNLSTRAWYDGIGYALASPAPKITEPKITQFKSLSQDIWQVSFIGDPLQSYQLEHSPELSFQLGGGLENLISTEVGTIGGPRHQVVTTDESGHATVQINLGFAAVNFIRVRLSPR